MPDMLLKKILRSALGRTGVEGKVVACTRSGTTNSRVTRNPCTRAVSANKKSRE